MKKAKISRNCMKISMLFAVLAACIWMMFSVRILAADSEIASGKCGENVTWKLDSGYKLVLEGEGATWDWTGADSSDYPPWYEYHESIKTVVVGENITELGSGLFYKCTNLKNVNIGSKVTRLRSYIFSHSNSLKTIAIPESVTEIGEQAFWESGLTSVKIPGNIKSIGNETFTYCVSLETVSFGGTMKEIPQKMFYGCVQLRNISWPKKLEKIGYQAFFCCYNLTGATIPEGTVSIGDEVFSMDPGSDPNLSVYESLGGAINLNYAVIPDSVTSMGSAVFKDCKALEEVEFSASLKEIPQEAFLGCSSLKEADLPKSVENIGYAAFSGCEKLKKLTGRNVLNNIEAEAFQNCSGLSQIILADKEVRIAGSAFTGAGTSNTVVYGRNESASQDLADEKNWKFKALDAAANYEVTLAYTSTTYSGSARKPSVEVSFQGKTLKSGTDYTVSYSSNVNAGTAKVKVTGKGIYAVTITKSFKIKQKSLKSADLTLSKTSVTYNKKAQKPSVTVKLGSKTLKKDTDYTVSYSNNTNAGTAKVIVKGKGNYKDAAEKEFTIKKASQTIKASSYKKAYKSSAFSIGASASGKGKLTYKSSKSSVAAVSSGGKVTVKAMGKATITITAAATSNYKKAVRKITVTVVPKKVNLKGVYVTQKKALTIKWKKDTSVTGYQIYCSTTKDFSKNTKSCTISGGSKESLTLTGLPSKKQYFIKIRAYKKIGDTKLYGSWSSIKENTTK